jgi:tetratricopeptide (TPR) repeat protein
MVTQGRDAAASAAGAGSGGKKPVMLGEYKSFAGSSDDKFNQYVRAAEGFMKQGKYYRAADAYTVASVYKREDPLGYAGKSCALFAAGEYMSSALYLATALELFPEYARFRIDLVALIGDRDKVETRLAEARQLVGRSRSAEVEFLLSYVYYQLGRLEFAKMSIEAASKRMPDSPAVGALKKAIDEYIASM